MQILVTWTDFDHFKQVWSNRVSLNYVNKVIWLLRNFIYVIIKVLTVWHDYLFVIMSYRLLLQSGVFIIFGSFLPQALFFRSTPFSSIRLQK